jgi:hypothetical protein
MGRAFDLVLSLVAAAIVALLLGTIADDYAGMTAQVVRLNALRAAGIIMAAVAGICLLKWKT